MIENAKHKKRLKLYLLLQGALVLLILAIILLFVFYPKEVTIEIRENQSLRQDPEVMTVKSIKPVPTVKDVLEENNINPEDEGYSVSPDLDEKISNESTIVVSRIIPVNLEVDGEPIETTSGEDTVGDLLYSLNIVVGEDDKVEPDISTPLTEETCNINVTRTIVTEETKQEEIPFETRKVLDTSLTEGQEVVTMEGSAGLKNVTEQITTIGGHEAERVVVAEETIKPPVAREIRTSDSEQVKSYRRDSKVRPVTTSVADTNQSGTQPTSGSGVVSEGNPLGIANTTRRADGSLDTTSVDSYARLVNNGNMLPGNYEPSDLVSMGYGNVTMRKDAAYAFFKMRDQIKQELGIEIVPLSGYRSYATQASLSSDSLTAPAGGSEHQLGLAIDIGIPGTEDFDIQDVGHSQTYYWLCEHAQEYGFELSMPENTFWVAWEPWHWRFVGLDLARNIYQARKNGDCIQFDDYITNVGK